MGRKHCWGRSRRSRRRVALAPASGPRQAQPQAQKLDKVTLQLKWVTQAQFAGYYAAVAKGYYKAFGLDVNLKVGGPSITPEQVVASGQAQIGVDWLPSLLATRDTGTNLVNIAQMFSRSGMTELTWKTAASTRSSRCGTRRSASGAAATSSSCSPRSTKNGMDPNNKGVDDLQPAVRHERLPQQDRSTPRRR